MQLVKVTPKFFEVCEKCGANKNKQLLESEAGRPCVLILSLKYHGKKRKFVVPIKSNIKSSEDKKNYFPLPPNNRTKPGCRHGVFYIKLFPVSSKYINPYYYNNNTFLVGIKKIIDDNAKEIVTSCQRYLERYENGDGTTFTPDINKIIDVLDNEKSN